MKFNFKQNLLLITGTLSVLSIASVDIVNLSATGFSHKVIRGTENISEVITVEGQGNVAFNKKISNLWFNHSEFNPTGIFVTKDSTVTINYPEGSTNIYAFVGQWGSYKDLNEGKDLKPEKIVLNSDNSTIFQPSQDGMLYISNQNFDIDIQVSIEVTNGIKVPTFKLDETTAEDFNQKLNQTTSPFVELIGKNVFGTFQISLANELWKNNLEAINKINDTVKNWDEIYQWSNYVSGLGLDFNGVARKYHNLIHIINPDTGAGYASATNYFVRFQQAGGAGKDLFTKEKKSQWGLWHEIGHTYQNLDYTFNAFTEVAVNINSFWIQEEQGFRNRIFNDKKTIAAIKDYINLNDPNKSIKNLDVWGRLGLFLQLHMAYGKEFFPRLNQEYRLLSSLEKPKNDEQKYQSFIKLTSKTANRNLIPFFEKWGIHADSDTINVVQNYPLLTKDIWNNIFDDHFEDNAIVDYKLEKYNPLIDVTVKKDALLKLNLGDQIDKEVIKNTLENVTADMKFEEIESPDWNTWDWDNQDINSYTTVNVSEPNKFTNKYLVPTKTTLNNSIRILGLYDSYKGIISLDTNENKFFINSSNTELHSVFKGKPYVSISIIDSNGATIYEMTANGDDSTMKFGGLSNISYQDNFKIKFWFREPTRGLYYDQNQWIKVKDSNSKGDITFEIINDQWQIVN